MENDPQEEVIDTSTQKFSAKPRAIDRPMSAIKRMMMQKREEKKLPSKEPGLPLECPYSGCMRKFVSSEQLTGHISRSHKTKDEDGSQKTASTPMPVKAKAKDQEIGEEQKKFLKEIVRKNKPHDYKPRPATSFVPENQQENAGFKWLKNVRPEEVPEGVRYK